VHHKPAGRLQRVVYTRALTRAVYRKSRADIAALLHASNRPSATEDLERLRRPCLCTATDSNVALPVGADGPKS